MKFRRNHNKNFNFNEQNHEKTDNFNQNMIFLFFNGKMLKNK